MTDTNKRHWFGMDSSGGRIGPFWWINSDTRPFPHFGPEVAIRFVIWGSCGFNPNQMRVHLKPIDEPC